MITISITDLELEAIAKGVTVDDLITKECINQLNKLNMKTYIVHFTERSSVEITGKNKLDACMNSGYPAHYFKNVLIEEKK